MSLKGPDEIQKPDFLDYSIDPDEQLRQLQQPKQTMKKAVNDAPGTQPGAETENVQNQPVYDFENIQEPKVLLTGDAATASAEMLADLIDNVVGSSAAFYAKSDAPSDYKSSPDEKQSLVNTYKQLVETGNLKVNPWYAAIGLNLAIYLPKVIQASNDRQINELKAELKNEISSLRDEVQKIKDDKDDK